MTTTLVRAPLPEGSTWSDVITAKLPHILSKDLEETKPAAGYKWMSGDIELGHLVTVEEDNLVLEVATAPLSGAPGRFILRRVPTLKGDELALALVTVADDAFHSLLLKIAGFTLKFGLKGRLKKILKTLEA